MSRITRRPLRAVMTLCAVFALAAPASALADNYVALGDSYSSGVGTNSYSLSSSCLRGVYAYPYLVSQQRPNTSLNFVACSGATTTSLMASQIQAVNCVDEHRHRHDRRQRHRVREPAHASARSAPATRR